MIELRRVVLDNNDSPIFNVLKQASIVHNQIRPHGISSYPNQDRVVFTEVAAGEILRRKKGHMHTQSFERSRHVVTASFDISNLLRWSNFHIGPSCLGKRRAI